MPNLDDDQKRIVIAEVTTFSAIGITMEALSHLSMFATIAASHDPGFEPPATYFVNSNLYGADALFEVLTVWTKWAFVGYGIWLLETRLKLYNIEYCGFLYDPM